MDSSNDVSALLSQRITLSDLTPLQVLLGNVLKAMTTMSEEVKVLRGDMEGIVHASAKINMELAHLKRSASETYCTRSELKAATDHVQEQHERVAAHMAEHQAASSRDREMLVQKVATLEVNSVSERSKRSSIEERLATVERFVSEDGKQLHTQLAGLIAVAKRHDDVQKETLSGSDARLAAVEKMVAQNFDEVSGINAAIIQRMERSEQLIQQTQAVVDRDRSVLNQNIQRVAAELARNEGIQAQVSSSLGKLVDSAIEKKACELQVGMEAIENTWSKKLQHTNTVLDVRIDGLKEHIMSLGQELSDVKSEMGVFQSENQAIQTRCSRFVDQVEEKMSEVNQVMDSAVAVATQRLQEANESNKTATMVLLNEEIHKALEGSKVEWKSQLQSSLERHNRVLLEGLLTQRGEETERINQEIDLQKQNLESAVGFWRLRLAEQSNLLKSLYHLFCVEPEKIPEDPADRLRFVRSLPWFPGPSLSTPVLVGSSSSQVVVDRGGGLVTSSTQGPASAVVSKPASIISPTLGIEVRNWVHHSQSGQQRGVEVLNVVVDGAAYHSGVHVGDVIVGVGDTAVTDVAQFSDALRTESARGKETPRLWLKRENPPSSPERRFFA